MDFDIFINLWENHGQVILDLGRRVIIALLIAIGGKIVIHISERLSNRALKRKIHADESFISILRIVIHYGIIIVCLIMILDVFGINTTGLIAILGAAGVAVGFALKDTLSNIAAGIMILFLRPFRTGDYIECGSTAGTVREIGLFATNLETPDGIYIAAPNSCLWGVSLINYSRNPKRRMSITVTISYSDSIDTAFQVLSDIISQEPRFLREPPAQVLVQSLGETGIGVTFRAWVSSDIYWTLYWEYMKKVKEKIQEAGLTIALPRREIHIAKPE